ncbi:uncharacterized protein [Physcomitrium patens]|uniref:uncharacterized protein isoform X3 n=1 Tax=Physcomitrium patens TaxID=3218 RepID=UPI000D1643E8|nr:uncharacterized protein LOC112295131 isoform X3 [Physcomitrium patens]|eukprot:XP_024402111.1 uncharacterized protein LOC112295131 isoform X3 [Physcomitrella patens]
MSSDLKPGFVRQEVASECVYEDRSSNPASAKAIPFAVVSCSSQDEDFPVSELNNDALGRGWQSSRFCLFPQEIVLELQHPSRIINMQLLCHEFMIPSKVEIFVSMINPHVHSSDTVGQMKRLGYFSLDPNDRSNHQARELKSVYVDSSAATIRLLLHNCYTNKLNIFNQVGLMAVIITGEHLGGQQGEYFNQHEVTKSSLISTIQVARTKGMDTRVSAPSSKAVAFDFAEVDIASGARLRQLFQDKVAAVGNEDYDEAKRLKKLIEKLKELGKKLKQFERRKFAAVEVEDYDTAKLCKMEMERLQRDEGLLDHEHIVRPKFSDRLESGIATKLPDNLQERSSCEETKEIWMQTVKDLNNAVKLNRRLEDHENLASCDGILDFKPAYSSFKIQERDFEVISTSSVLSNEKPKEVIPEILPWYQDHSILNTSEISPPPTVSQALRAISSRTLPPLMKLQNVISCSPTPLICGTNENGFSDKYLPGVNVASSDMRQSVPTSAKLIASSMSSSTFCATNTTPPADLSANVLTHLQQELPVATSPSLLTSSLVSTSNFNEASFTPRLAPLKLHLATSPTGLLNSSNHEPATTTTTTGTQYQPEMPPHPSLLPTSPMQEESVLCACPSTTPRVSVDSNADHNSEGLFSSTPESQQYHEANTTLMVQEQTLPVHNGDVPSSVTATGNELVPEPLADNVKMEAGPLLSVMDFHHVECLFSKHWQLRDKALQFLIDEVSANKLLEEPGPSFRMMNKVLLRTLNDRVANVFNTSLQLLRAVITTYTSTVPHRDLHIASSGFTVILLEKLGDLNARTKEGSFETLMFLASRKEIGIMVLSGPLLKLPKNQANWRPVLGRLQLLQHAVPLYGIQPPNGTGFPSDALMNFVIQAFNNPNGEVRNQAIKVTTEVYRSIGPSVDKYLKGIKPLIKEILTSNFEKVVCEFKNEEGKDRSFTPDEPGKSQSAGPSSGGLRPMIQDHIEELESGDKGNKPTASASMSKEQSGQLEQKIEEPETPITSREFPLKGSPDYYHANSYTKETKWEHIQKNALLVEVNEDLTESEAAYDYHSVQTHSSDEVASPDTQNAQNADNSSVDKDENVDSCLFCGKQDARFKEGDNLDLHFCEQCPMLASCSSCGQIVEISSLKDHYLFECVSGRRYVECQKCYLAIPELRLAAHHKSKDCKMSKQHKLLRCPLCYRTVHPSDKGWREHILQQPGCLRNPRTSIYAS